MGREGTRERRLEERVCCEDGCDRPPAWGDVRCELHVLRLGRALLPRPVEEVAPLEVPTEAAQVAVPLPPVEVPKRAGPRLAVAAACQVLGLASLAALLETFRFFDLHAFDDLPDLALFEVPYSSLLNLYLPAFGGIALLAGQLVLAWQGRRAARSPAARWLGTGLYVAGLVTAAASLAVAADPLMQLLVGRIAP